MTIVDEDMMEGSMNSLQSNLNVETLSPEDVAWADSCLNEDVDAADIDLTSMKDALFEILSSQAESLANFSVAQSSVSLTADKFFRPGENLTSMASGSGSAKDEDLIADFGEAESIDISDDEDGLLSRIRRGRERGNMHEVFNVRVFRPNYSEDVKFENLDFDLSSSFTTIDIGPSLEDIFKVWDLGISDEQDELTVRLNKALADVLSQIQSNTDDSVTLKDLMHVSIDDIISGIGDLSLKQYT